ncbi:MAG TPA: ATP-binding protein, partial [Anaeromyxobacteraceae bacterium]|nr:ATP-binding protein [Anaeromyxobacteraceae bacterium]
GLFVTMDRRLGRGSFLDCGAFLQSVMVAARGRGLDTCPQAAFTQFHRIIESQLGLAICHALVTAHGGTISARSAPGTGTTMRVELPAP